MDRLRWQYRRVSRAGSSVRLVGEVRNWWGLGYMLMLLLWLVWGVFGRGWRVFRKCALMEYILSIGLYGRNGACFRVLGKPALSVQGFYSWLLAHNIYEIGCEEPVLHSARANKNERGVLYIFLVHENIFFNIGSFTLDFDRHLVYSSKMRIA